VNDTIGADLASLHQGRAGRWDPVGDRGGARHTSRGLSMQA
jgi:hypothetical protein